MLRKTKQFINNFNFPNPEWDDLPEGFFRVDKIKSKKNKGTGLGLSLVKNIIEKHSGNIEVFSKENKGTTFEFFFKRFDV